MPATSGYSSAEIVAMETVGRDGDRRCRWEDGSELRVEQKDFNVSCSLTSSAPPEGGDESERVQVDPPPADRPRLQRHLQRGHASSATCREATPPAPPAERPRLQRHLQEETKCLTERLKCSGAAALTSLRRGVNLKLCSCS
ncbi:uncharacterized protein V6R79_001072 [Siganus canaliculatus]